MSKQHPATHGVKQVAYLAGPMRGIPEYNFPAFYAAAAAIRKHGLDVWSPAEHDVNQDGFDPAKDTAQPMRHYMKRDLPAVLDADMVCVLPGWENSQGAQLEVHVARACGIPVYNAHDFSPVSETAPLVAGDLAKQREIHDTYAPVSAIAPLTQREKLIQNFISVCASTAFDRDDVRAEAKHIVACSSLYEKAPNDRI